MNASILLNREIVEDVVFNRFCCSNQQEEPDTIQKIGKVKPDTVMENVGLILKVVGVSAGVAIAIRYLAPLVTWPSSAPVVLALVLLPTVVMGVLLTWRGQQEC